MPTVVTLTSPSDRVGGDPLKLAFCWAHGRKADQGHAKEWIAHRRRGRWCRLPRSQDRRRYPGLRSEYRRAVRQDLSLPLVDEFFTWLAKAKRVSQV